MNASLRIDYVVVFRQVGEFILERQFLDADVRIVAGGAVGSIDAGDTGLLRIQVVEVEHRGEAKLPVNRLESRVAMEQVERHG